MPFARRLVELPVDQGKFLTQPLLNFRRTHLQIFEVVLALLPEIALEVVLLPHKHGLVVEKVALKALGSLILVSHDGVPDALTVFFLGD